MMLLFIATTHVCLMVPPSHDAPVSAPSGPGLPGVGTPLPKRPKPTPEEERITALHKAAFEGDLCTVKAILTDHPKLVDRPPVFRSGGKDVPDLSTALHGAAVKGDVDIVRFLLKKGANPNAKMDQGYTPLHYAVSSGSSEVVRLLLENKADPNARGWQGWRPLHRAAANGQTEIALLLVKAGASLEARTDDIPAKPIRFLNPDTPPQFIPASPGRTAAQIARDGKREKLAKILTR
ncbi:Ankyrin repeats (3 copies) [Gemmata sp. SH-PL17]|uniref:ankyrin repeat domain-containing protein n=1 Tax=Gemmata sp. SH-PL17 TaxID=1630693 RepID=UPI0006991F71|nr:ankyrin repeat domain-containing protein [Gemmata sp. SH-PL17]AMV22933.1 Ankyrin repeats (3 copies) [Gemmata sp. SH-PL17]